MSGEGSAGVGSDFDSEGGQNVTDPYAQLGHNMYDKNKLAFHTQVDKPDPMTMLDVFAEYLEEEATPGAARLLREAQKWKRTNMVAFKRERAKETERMVKGDHAEEAREQKKLKEIMTGVQR